jgi:hypothetical protein
MPGLRDDRDGMLPATATTGITRDCTPGTVRKHGGRYGKQSSASRMGRSTDLGRNFMPGNSIV